MVLVSLLVDQLSGLFLIFFGQPKKNCLVSGNFWLVAGNFWSTKFLFGIPKNFLVDQFFFGRPKIPRDWPKIPWDWTIFFWSTKKNEKKTGQLVDQETDQNHMDGTQVDSFLAGFSYLESLCATLQSTAVFWVPLSSRVFFGMMISLLFQTFSVKLKRWKNEGNRLERCIPEIWKQLIRYKIIHKYIDFLDFTDKLVQAFRCIPKIWKQLKKI